MRNVLTSLGSRSVSTKLHFSRGDGPKKTLEIDPVHAETVRLIFRLAREGSGSSGPMGIKSIATHFNASGIRTRDGGRWASMRSTRC